MVDSVWWLREIAIGGGGSNINARPSYSATGRPSRVSARGAPR